MPATSNNMEDEIVKEAWKTVMYQPEAPELVADMVLAAGTALREDEHYQSYRTGLEKLLKEDDSLKPLLHRSTQEAIVNNNETDSEHKEKTNVDTEESAHLHLSSLIDDWIVELLCFLAMKALIAKGPVPSISIRAAWKALLLFPTTYDNICKSMGSSYSEVDCDYELSKDQKNEFYALTKLSYEVLFDGVVPLTCWPIKPDDVDINESQKSLAPGAANMPSVGRNESNKNEMSECRAVVLCTDAAADNLYDTEHSIDDDGDNFVKDAWKRVVHQPDAPEVVQEMVLAAGTALQGDVNYQPYRTSLFKMLEEKDSLKSILRFREVIMNKNKSESKHIDTEIKSSFIDEWIGELLRFLAMKALIVREPIPSICIRAAWQKLVLFPTTYSNVCEAMGSSNREVDCVSESSKDQKNEFYTLTMLGYGALFGEVAPLMFWPTNPDNVVDKECLIDLVPRAVGAPIVGVAKSSKEPQVQYDRGAMSSIGRSKPSANVVSNPSDAIEYGSKYDREENRMCRPTEPDYNVDEEPRVRFTPEAVVAPCAGRSKSSANKMRKGRTSASAMHTRKYAAAAAAAAAAALAAANNRHEDGRHAAHAVGAEAQPEQEQGHEEVRDDVDVPTDRGGDDPTGCKPDIDEYNSDCGSEYSSEDDAIDHISLNPETTTQGFVDGVKWAISDFMSIFYKN